MSWQLRFNGRFLLRLGVVALVLGAVGFFAHRVQAKKLVAAYRDQADRARADGKPAAELDYLRRYLLAVPTDAEARARSGALIARLATKPADRLAAYLTLQEALRQDPNLPADVRAQAVKLAMHPTVALPEEARRDLDVLRKFDPNNIEYAELDADCLLGVRDYAGADAALTALIARDKARVPAYAKQAWCRRTGLAKPDLAGETVEAMLFANPNSAAAFVAAADHWRAVRKPDRNRQAVERARQLAPADPDVVFAVTELRLEGTEDMRRRGDKAGRAAAFTEVADLLTKLIADLTPKLPAADAPPESGSDTERAQASVAFAYHRLVGVLVNADKLDAARTEADKAVKLFPGSPVARLDRADVLVTGKKLDEADAALAELAAVGAAPGLVDFHRGRVLAQREKWPAACRALESAAVGLANDPGLLHRANLLLALCYRETGELDRRYEAFRKATPTDPSDPDWAPAVAGVADTLARMGRFGDALAEYRRLAPFTADVFVPLVRLGIEDTLRRPPGPDGKRDWTLVEDDLRRVTPGPDADLLAAELLAAKSQLAAARDKVTEALTRTGDSVRLWSMRVLLELADNQAGRAADLLKQAEAKVKDSADMRLLRLRVHMAGPATVAGIEAVAAGVEKLAPGERRTVLTACAAAAQSPKVNRRDLAKTWLDRVAAERPDDIDLQFARFDVALLDKDQAGVDAVIAQLAATTGGPDTVPSKVARAFAILDRAKPGDPSLTEAAELLDGLERQRGGWGRLFLAQGRVADLRGDLPTAAGKYRLAVNLGERNPAVVGRLLDLYSKAEKYADAESLVRAVPSAGATGAGAEILATLLIGAKNYNQAVELAEKAVPLATTSDPSRLMWLARVRLAAGRMAEAEAPVRKVTTLDPARADGWVTLVQVLAALNKPAAEVDATIAAAEKAITPADAALALAQCYETVKKFPQAQAKYDALAAPADAPPAALRAAAGFAVRRGNVDAAKRLADRLLASGSTSDDDKKFGRRLLALLVSAQGGPDATARALQALGVASVEDAAAVADTDPAEEVRTRAVVVARLRGRRPRETAVRLLEKLEARGPLTPEDDFLLAQLYEALGYWPRARARFARVAGAPNPPRVVTVAYAFALLRNGEADAARREIDRLGPPAPDDQPVAELRARLAVADNKPDDAVAIAKALGDAQKRPEVTAALLEQVGLPDRADPFYRAAATTPAGRLGLGSYLARRDKLAQAWAEFDAVWSQVPPQIMVPTACEAVLQAGASSPEVVKKVRARVAEAVASAPALEVYLAAVDSLLGDYDGSVRRSRAVLDRNPTDLVALNNLAYLVALHGKNPDEALKLVDKAIATAGPVPTLLDTKGLILTEAGRGREAVEVLKEAVIDEPTAMTYFHLAHAHVVANDPRSDCKNALDAARRRNLRAADFPPLERPNVAAVSAKIDGR